MMLMNPEAFVFLLYFSFLSTAFVASAEHIYPANGGTSLGTHEPGLEIAPALVNQRREARRNRMQKLAG